MRHRRFGSTGREVPIVGQRTWNMERDGQRAVEALRHGLGLGMTHVDTAEMYGDGRVEKLVREAIEGCFLLRFPSLFAIPKAANAEHAAENAAAAEIQLTEEELVRIDEAFPRGRRRRGVPTI